MKEKKRVLYREPYGRASRRYFNNCDGWSDHHRAAKKFNTYAQAMHIMLELKEFTVGIRIGKI